MKWLSRNYKNRFRRALRHPGYTIQSFLHDLLGIDERFLASITNSTPEAIRQFLTEAWSHPGFMQHVKDCEPELRAASHPGNDPYAKKVLIQYALARALAPDVIVETGVANGISSSYLLLACHLNGRGLLYSFDFDSGVYLPPGKPTGWMVPDYLRPRWSLMLEDSRESCPRLMKSLAQVDMFIHDSDHTYEQMKFELELGYTWVRPAGLVLCDDANFNVAFAECVETFQPAEARVIRNVGIMKKRLS